MESIAAHSVFLLHISVSQCCPLLLPFFILSCILAPAVPVVIQQFITKYTPPSTYTYKLSITNAFLRPISSLTLKAKNLNASTIIGLTAVAGKPGFYQLTSKNLPLKGRTTASGVGYTQMGPAATFTAHSWTFVFLQMKK